MVNLTKDQIKRYRNIYEKLKKLENPREILSIDDYKEYNFIMGTKVRNKNSFASQKSMVKKVFESEAFNHFIENDREFDNLSEREIDYESSKIRNTFGMNYHFIPDIMTEYHEQHYPFSETRPSGTKARTSCIFSVQFERNASFLEIDENNIDSILEIINKDGKTIINSLEYENSMIYNIGITLYYEYYDFKRKEGGIDKTGQQTGYTKGKEVFLNRFDSAMEQLRRRFISAKGTIHYFIYKSEIKLEFISI